MNTTNQPDGDPVFRLFMRRAAELAERTKQKALAREEERRARQVAPLRNPAGPANHGPAGIAAILGSARTYSRGSARE